MTLRFTETVSVPPIVWHEQFNGDPCDLGALASALAHVVSAGIKPGLVVRFKVGGVDFNVRPFADVDNTTHPIASIVQLDNAGGVVVGHYNCTCADGAAWMMARARQAEPEPEPAVDVTTLIDKVESFWGRHRGTGYVLHVDAYGHTFIVQANSTRMSLRWRDQVIGYATALATSIVAQMSEWAAAQRVATDAMKVRAYPMSSARTDQQRSPYLTNFAGMVAGAVQAMSTPRGRRMLVDDILRDDARRYPAFCVARKVAIVTAYEGDRVADDAAPDMLAMLRTYEELRGCAKVPSRAAQDHAARWFHSGGVNEFISNAIVSAYERARSLT